MFAQRVMWVDLVGHERTHHASLGGGIQETLQRLAGDLATNTLARYHIVALRFNLPSCVRIEVDVSSRRTRILE